MVGRGRRVGGPTAGGQTGRSVPRAGSHRRGARKAVPTHLLRAKCNCLLKNCFGRAYWRCFCAYWRCCCAYGSGGRGYGNGGRAHGNQGGAYGCPGWPYGGAGRRYEGRDDGAAGARPGPPMRGTFFCQATRRCRWHCRKSYIWGSAFALAFLLLFSRAADFCSFQPGFPLETPLKVTTLAHSRHVPTPTKTAR